MKEFFDPENYNKLESIIVSNIQQHPNYDSSIQIKDILKKNMMDIYNAYKKTYESMSISDQILQYNSNTIRESIPKLIEILNNKKEDKTASAIDKYINQKLIPEIEVKMRSKWSSEFDIPEKIVDAIRIMNSAPFLESLSKALDIPKLIPDPYFTGGGLNVTVSGGLLDVHVDGNYHDATGLHRRVNAILYLNPGWQEGWD